MGMGREHRSTGAPRPRDHGTTERIKTCTATKAPLPQLRASRRLKRRKNAARQPRRLALFHDTRVEVCATKCLLFQALRPHLVTQVEDGENQQATLGHSAEF